VKQENGHTATDLYAEGKAARHGRNRSKLSEERRARGVECIQGRESGEREGPGKVDKRNAGYLAWLVLKREKESSRQEHREELRQSICHREEAERLSAEEAVRTIKTRIARLVAEFLTVQREKGSEWPPKADGQNTPQDTRFTLFSILRGELSQNQVDKLSEPVLMGWIDQEFSLQSEEQFKQVFTERLPDLKFETDPTVWVKAYIDTFDSDLSYVGEVEAMWKTACIEITDAKPHSIEYKRIMKKEFHAFVRNSLLKREHEQHIRKMRDAFRSGRAF
jgi:hypothetical protein